MSDSSRLPSSHVNGRRAAPPAAPLFAAGERRTRGWERVSHGLYVPATDIPYRDARLAALASTLHPGGGFTHLSGAHILGWWLPPIPPGLPEFAAQDARNRPRRRELRIIRTTPDPTVTRVRGLPIVSPEDILLACARHLGLLDVVVLLDAALVAGDTSWPRLWCAASRRRFGVRRLRSALLLADDRSESPFESLLRVLHVVCDVPVQPQFELWYDGEFRARGDLWLRGTTTFHEYDGAEHRRSKRRHRADLRRERRIADTDWIRRGYTDVEVLRQPGTILRDADRSLGRPHDPARLQAWYALLRESCFTPSGQARLLERLGLARPSTGACA
jgi:hypothetical protein